MDRILKVLVVDDEEAICETLRMRLEAEQYEVSTACNGQKCLDLLSEGFRPDVIILDALMPGINGVEVCKQIKSSPDYTLIPIIMLTACCQTEEKVEGLEAGADDYITKPYIWSELHARIRAALRDKSLHASLQDLAMRDHLTALYNRRFFQQILDKKYEESKRYSQPFSLIMFDVDGFKGINDQYGHPFGDAVLRDIGKILEATCRKSDYLFRYGGDEFIIIPDQYTKDVDLFARKISQAIREHVFPYDGTSVHCSVSIGTFIFDGANAGSSNDILRRVDEALYEAKRQRGDRKTSPSLNTPEQI